MIRNVTDPVSASKLLVDHALGRFSTDNLSCMIVRFDKEALLQSQSHEDVGVETEKGPKGVSEVDKIVKEVKQKIADGSTPAVGVSASNSGRGRDPIAVEEKEEFVPTTLDDAVVEEEPIAVFGGDGSEKGPNAAPIVPLTHSPEVVIPDESVSETAKKTTS